MSLVYFGSFDPPHNGHLNTYLKAQKELGSGIKVCICVGDLKKGLLTAEERLRIAQSLFPADDIIVCGSRESIVKTLTEAGKIVRGFRGQPDIDETMKIGKFYGVESLEHKLVFVKIDDEFYDVCSSGIKQKFYSDEDYIKRALNSTGIEILRSKELL
ncbi:MAG: adenylyltransferase/cytidyltransferase family protein [Chitinispirillales bacterium]|jgi:cytidyltransferase-like protein|nr:adenylyltransferase/cytidyltransferase family protein [Chitinispirillales bacterium]